MYCSECGTKNEEGTKFCEECGHEMIGKEKKVPVKKEKIEKIEKNEEKKEANKQEINLAAENDKNINKQKKSNKLIYVILSIGIILFGTYYYLDNYVYSPKITADDYMMALEDSDFDKLYEVMISSKSDFVTKEKFEEYMNDYGDDIIDSYEYEKTREKKDEATVYYEVKIDGEKEDLEVELIAEDKIFFIFNEWIINSEEANIIVEDYEISVPKGSEIKIDDIKVESNLMDKDESDDEYDVYVIPELLGTSYELEVLLPYGISITKEMYVTDYDDEYEVDYFSTSDLSDEDADKLANEAMGILQTLYDNAIASDNFNDVKDEYNYKGIMDSFEDDFNDLVDNVKSSYSILKEINLSDAKLSSISVDDGILNISIKVDMEYTVDDINYDDTIEEKTDKESDSYEMIYMIYEDGEFKLAGIDYISSYFYVY